MTLLLVLSMGASALDLVLQRRGPEVCAVSAGQVQKPCYQTLKSLGVAFSSDTEYLQPHVTAYVDWINRSPDRWPTDVDGLDRIGGALLLDPEPARLVVAQLRWLNVRNLAVNVDPPWPRADIPFALTVDWKDALGNEGSSSVVGTLKIVDDIFALNLSRPLEFRDRFVNNLSFTAIAGSPPPLVRAGVALETPEILRTVIAPYLAGKFVSLGRIGFNGMREKLQGDLEYTLREHVRKNPPRDPL